jgi:hypothetical protein
MSKRIRAIALGLSIAAAALPGTQAARAQYGHGSIVGGLVQLPLAQVWPPTCAVEPPAPLCTDSVVITMSGEWFNTCIPNFCSPALSGSTIYFDMFIDYPPGTECYGVVTPWALTGSVGLLFTGTYEVVATLYAGPYPGYPIAGPTLVCGFAVTPDPSGPPALTWYAETPLTQDDLSDSAPAMALHNGELHVLWNRSYGGEVHHGVLDPVALTLLDLGAIADCPTGCGPGTASYGGSLYAFYAQGDYPNYQLFGQNLSDGSGPFELDNGFVRYGAASVVYADKLYVFWTKWIGGPRYVLYRAFDGNTWSAAVTVANDDYSDARPAVAVFNGQLYLFYRSGERYKVLNGMSWSDELTLVDGTDVNITPAACAYNGLLCVYFRLRGQLACRRFDGGSWSCLEPVPASPVDEVRDIAAAVRGGRTYLLWGSYYSWPRSELYVKPTPAPGDLNCDGVVDFADINPFVLALSDPAAYAVTYSNCDIMTGDINADGSVDFGDINPFVALLTGGGG